MKTQILRNEHPRLYFGKDDISSIREKIKEGIPKQIWEGLYKKAKETEISEILEDEGKLEYIEIPEKVRNILGNITRPRFMKVVYDTSVIGFVWAVTHDKQFAEKGRRWLVQSARVVMPKPKMKGFKFHCDDYICLNLAESYDWLYDCLTEEERLIVRRSIAENYVRPCYEMEGTLWPEKQKQGGDYDYCEDAIGILFGAIGVATLSIMGDEPYQEYTKEWLKVCEKWIKGYLDAIGRGGDWHEGIHYAFTGLDNACRFLTALKRVVGENWTNHPHFKQVPYFYLYSLLSGDKGLVNFGDAEYAAVIPPTRVLLPLADNPYGKWCYQNMRKTKDKYEGTSHDGSPVELIWYNEKIVAKSPDDLPLSRHFRDMGLVVLRTGWETEDVYFALRCSTPWGGHTHVDFTSFILDAYGERLVIDPGTGPYSYTKHESVDYYYNAFAHNVIVVNENELTPYGIHDYQRGRIEELGKIRVFLSKPDYDYILADASSVFRGVLRKNLRHVLFIRPDYFVIYDEITCEDDKIILDWLLHSLKGTKIEVEGNNISFDREKASLNVRVILPEEFTHTIEYGWTADKHWGEPVKEDPYIKIRPVQKNKETKFLTVLYPLSKERGTKLPMITKISDRGRMGIKVERGGSCDIIITGERNLYFKREKGEEDLE